MRKKTLLCFLSALIFIFLINFCFQFFSYKYYLFDRYFYYVYSGQELQLVFWRTLGISLIWIAGLFFACLIYFWLGKKIGAILFYVWAIVWGINLMFWFINLQIVYYSGLFIRPILLQHIEGASGVIFCGRFFIFLAISLAFAVMPIYFFRKKIKLYSQPSTSWFYACLTVTSASIVVGIIFSAHNLAPEFVVARSFYKEFFSEKQSTEMLPRLEEKLKRFGLEYNTNQFFVVDRPNVFSDSVRLLPDKFVGRRPNVIILFFESLSSRLTSIYNPQFAGVTPALQSFADEPGSTVFKQFYNASTPTVAGLYSLLCSSLPAFDSVEIRNLNKLAGHHSLCLPSVLKKSGGYKTAVYMMGHEKEFASGGRMLMNMGFDAVLDQKYLSQELGGKTVHWGYNDYQMFSAVWNHIKQLSADSPFVLSFATVNTHPPFFGINGDKIPFGDGSNELLKSVLSTDDAFGWFWQEFKNSELYNNTILVAVADHSMFPGKQFNELISSQSYYDENFFVMHIPNSILPREVDVLSSGIDLTPTLLQILGINVKNSFEGRSIFDDRKNYPAVLGMSAFGLYIKEGDAPAVYNLTNELYCSILKNENIDINSPLTLCELYHFYLWKKQMFEDGRLWWNVK